MKKRRTNKVCVSFKPISDYISHYRNNISQNCNECVYFSSRNCGFDVSDSIETELEIF